MYIILYYIKLLIMLFTVSKYICNYMKNKNLLLEYPIIKNILFIIQVTNKDPIKSLVMMNYVINSRGRKSLSI